VEFTEVNLALEPSRRAEMVAISASTALPQLVVDNVFLGDADAIQELENRGALIARLT
jgi:glutaredoxin-related protein